MNCRSWVWMRLHGSFVYYTVYHYKVIHCWFQAKVSHLKQLFHILHPFDEIQCYNPIYSNVTVTPFCDTLTINLPLCYRSQWVSVIPIVVVLKFPKMQFSLSARCPSSMVIHVYMYLVSVIALQYFPGPTRAKSILVPCPI